MLEGSSVQGFPRGLKKLRFVRPSCEGIKLKMQIISLVCARQAELVGLMQGLNYLKPR